MPRPNKREQLLDAALRLFYRDGFHATGIDTVVAEAGVARMTLYKHFRSKDDLILAALRRRDEQFRAWFLGEVERRAKTPRDRLLAVFDVLEDWYAGRTSEGRGGRPFSGCAFVKAMAEYSDADSPVHRAAAEHKRMMRDYLERLAGAAGAEAPGDLADEFSILIEGATVMAQATCDPAPARRARRMAEALLATALPEPAGA